MRIFPKVSTFFLVLMLLSSCIVPPSTYVKPTFHLLNESTSDNNESFRQVAVFAERNQTIEGQSFYLRQIELPYYLQENRIITRPQKGKIEFRENDRWGEPLVEGIGRVTGFNLSRFLNSPFYSVYPHRQKIGTQWEVGVTMLRFEKISGERVLLEASWEIFHNGYRNGNYPFKNNNTKIEVDIESPSSGNELVSYEVDALSHSLGKLAERIARAMINSDLSEF
tara:strand:- start:438 stop:1109 length:672 start_codon:yes stop_codon:yes gene_type:complete